MEEKTRLMEAALLGTGFAGGLFLRTGLDPYGTTFKAIFEMLSDWGIPSYVGSIVLISISILSFVKTLKILKKVYGAGKILGLIAVGLAFVSGWFILDATQEAGGLLVVATILGLIAIERFSKDRS